MNDLKNTYNMMSFNYVRELGLPLALVRACSIILPNNESSDINHQMLKVSRSIQGVDTSINLAAWSGAQYGIILGMA